MSGDITAKKLIMEPSTPSIPDRDIAWFSFEKVNDVLSPVLYWKYEGDIYFLNMSSLIQKKTKMEPAGTIYTIDDSSTIKVLKPINTFQQHEINTNGTVGKLVSNKYYTLNDYTGKFSPLSDGYYYKSQTTKGSILPYKCTVNGGTILTPYNCLVFSKIGVYGKYKYENDTMQDFMSIVGGDNFIMALPNALKIQTTINASSSTMTMNVNISHPQYTILKPTSNILASGGGSYFHSTVNVFSTAWLRTAIFSNGNQVGSQLDTYITRGGSGSNSYTALIPYTGSVSELTHYNLNAFNSASDTTFTWLKQTPS
jgi:hypothetical protein